MKFGKLQPKSTVEFDGYQELMNWTSAGSESSVSLTVDGDTDMEYVIEARNLTAQNMNLRLNNASSNYGRQALCNVGGTISALRQTLTYILGCYAISLNRIIISTINGFPKFTNMIPHVYTSGTTISDFYLIGDVYNSTNNITSLNFICNSGNFTAGTNIRVLGRRAK